MRGFLGLAVATATAFITSSVAVPLVAQPSDHVEITALNTLNDTAPGVAPAAVQVGSGLTLGLYNNYGVPANAFVTAHDPNGAVVILKADGTWYRPDPAGSTDPVLISPDVGIRIPLAVNGTTEVTLPSSATSGRVYVVANDDLVLKTLVDPNGVIQLVEPSFANINDPNSGKQWGFVEFSATSDGAIYANLSFVDFIGTLFSIGITLADGSTQFVQGLETGALQSICDGLNAQAALDGQPWNEMCITSPSGSVLRILSPNIFVDNNKTAMATYYSSYVDQVWATYTAQNLTLEIGSGPVACSVNSAGNLACAGDADVFPKPAIEDIWGCNDGAFARIVGNDFHEALRPVLCAAFDRTTLLLAGGNVQPSLSADNYYKNNPTNHYSRLVHQYEVGNRGYAFSFDDVNPGTGVDQSGTLSGPNVTRFDVYFGGK